MNSVAQGIALLCVFITVIVMGATYNDYRLVKEELALVTTQLADSDATVNDLRLKLSETKVEPVKPKSNATLVYVNMDKSRLAHNIREVAKYLDIPHVEQYVDLLLYTALIESNMGIYRKQKRGPALSPFQIEPATEKSMWDVYLKRNPVWASKIDELRGHAIVSHLENNLEYSIAMTIMYYMWRDKNPPEAGDWKAIAQYHKQHFNTYLGKADPVKGEALAKKVFGE